MKSKPLIALVILVCGVAILASCEKLLPHSPKDDELLDGPVEGLTHEQQKQFLDGDIAWGELERRGTLRVGNVGNELFQ